MARLKSSSSGLRLAFYPEHILWERELWSRLRDHIKQWLFVVNKARAACRGPSHSLSPSLSCSLSCHYPVCLPSSWTVRQMCASAPQAPSIPFFICTQRPSTWQRNRQIFKFITNSKSKMKSKTEGLPRENS